MAIKKINPKKRVAISYANLTPELLEALKAKYPLGYTDEMIRIDKPNGEFFYAVVLETEEISYLVKVNVKIDSNPQEEIEKELFESDEVDDIKDAEQVIDVADSDDE